MQSKVNGNEVTITFFLHEGKPSSTGKSLIRFSTNGFTHLDGPEGLKISINVIQPSNGKVAGEVEEQESTTDGKTEKTKRSQKRLTHAIAAGESMGTKS